MGSVTKKQLLQVFQEPVSEVTKKVCNSRLKSLGPGNKSLEISSRILALKTCKNNKLVGCRASVVELDQTNKI